MSTATQTAAEQLLARYTEAWNSHDVEGILSMHTDDTEFHVHIVPDPVVGKDAMRQTLEGLFATWAGYTFEAEHVHVYDDLIVARAKARATLTAPFTIGPLTLEPTGREMVFSLVDVMPIENGLFKRKDTYLDLAAIISALSE